MPSLPVAIKALTQLGPEPIALFALYQLGLRTGHYKRVESRDWESRKRSVTLQPLLSLPPREDLLRVLSEEDQAALLDEANEITAGYVRVFGERIPLKFTFDQPLRHWIDYELHPQLLTACYSPFPDVKFIWEPARFGWALTLGRAYRLRGDERYAESFWKCLEEFRSANPPYFGPHWMNGQEVALRLMSLLWAAQMFERATVSSPERGARLVESIAEHARRIPPTLIYARSQNNNHWVTESAALFAAGVALDEPKMRAEGWTWLNRALQRQISSYGEYIQHSTNYHRVMLQSVLWVDAILRRRREHWPPGTLEALMRASHWLFSMIDPISGRAPNLGANDGALILPLSSAAFGDYRPTVQAAARAFLRTGLPPGQWDELSLWLRLPAAGRTAESDAYMTEHLRGRNSWGYLRASRFASRLSHMDQLHFDLWRGGRNLAMDAGTYLYNAPAPWDNPLVATRVHNTITVDGQDEMQRGGRFLSLDWRPAFSKRILETDERILDRMLAYHKGYERLGIRHERVASVFADEHWEIADRLLFTKPGEHVFRLHWLLMDGEWQMVNPERGIELRVKTPDGWFALKVTPDARIAYSEVQVSLVRAGELVHGHGSALPFEGWSSPSYGVKTPALSLSVQTTSKRSTSFTSEFRFS